MSAALRPASDRARRRNRSEVEPSELARRMQLLAAKEFPQMLYWTAVFFVIAIIAAFFGFSGISAATAGIAKILFVAFLVLGALSLLFGRRFAR
ncbi:MAG: DUF1328 domain-containing protein [Polyangiaceae bacterium]